MNLSSRRSILRSGAGAALLAGAVPHVAGLLVGCRRSTHEATMAPDPNTTMSFFAVDEATIRKVMAELTARGADAADLYFEHSRSNSITMEDGIISRAASSVDQGVGLRVVVGEQTGYAFTEDLSLEAMLAAARTAATIAHGGKAHPPVALAPRSHADYYPLGRVWADVGIADKLPIVERVDRLARALDPAVEKVTVNWGDGEEQILLIDMHGNVFADGRPMTRLWCTVTARKDGQLQSGSANVAGRRGIDWYTEERLRFLTKEAIDRTMILFEARRPPAGEMPVVLAAGASGILLHEAIGHGMEADFN
ncbi:MAG TPA: DNA gyrase modulator, partial [Nannocystaceae bacterium]|nr:DNA gyrase modulator [Nannocystaceae bacterium]